MLTSSVGGVRARLHPVTATRLRLRCGCDIAPKWVAKPFGSEVAVMSQRCHFCQVLQYRQECMELISELCCSEVADASLSLDVNGP